MLDKKSVNNKLCQSCYASHLDGIKEALSQGAEANYDFGEPLIYVIKGKGSLQQKKKSIACLKEAGADLNIGDGAALKWAVIQKSPELLDFLIKKGLDVNRDGGMAVFHAAQQNDVEMLSYLFENGANLEEDVLEELNNLDCMKDDGSLIKKLIDEKSGRALPSKPVTIQKGRRRDSKPQVAEDKMEDSDEEKEKRRKKAPEPTELLWNAAEKNDVDTIRRAIDSGTNINSTNDNRWTALMQASHRGHLKAVEILLDAGVDVTIESDAGFTAFTLAVQKNHVAVVEMLLRKRPRDVDIDKPIHAKGEYRTPLMVSSGYGRTASFYTLLAYGVDVNAVCQGWDTVMHTMYYQHYHHYNRRNDREDKGREHILRALLAYVTPEYITSITQPAIWNNQGMPGAETRIIEELEQVKSPIPKLRVKMPNILEATKLMGFQSFQSSVSTSITIFGICRDPWNAFRGVPSAVIEYMLGFVGVPQIRFLANYPEVFSHQRCRNVGKRTDELYLNSAQSSLNPFNSKVQIGRSDLLPPLVDPSSIKEASSRQNFSRASSLPMSAKL